MRHVAFRAAVLFGSLVLALSAVSTSGAEPRISVSPREGSTGDEMTVYGDGFEPNDTIYISIHPPLGGYGIGVVSADLEGKFTATTRVGNVYDTEPFPEQAPPGEGYEVQLSPGDYEILAYPASFGGRTAETIAQAPKVSFKVTASALPSTGGEPGTGGRGFPVEVVAAPFLLIGGIFVWTAASRRTCVTAAQGPGTPPGSDLAVPPRPAQWG
jgi:hypothetical protein